MLTSQWLAEQASVQGEVPLSEIDVIASKCILELREHADRLTRLTRIAPLLLGAKENMDGKTPFRSRAGCLTFAKASSRRLGSLLDHQGPGHGTDMVKMQMLEMRMESLRWDVERIGESLRMRETEKMCKNHHHKHLKGDRIAFSKLMLKEGAKAGRCLHPPWDTPRQ